MKICFFLQRRFAYIGHAMAYNIKQEFPDTDFCGYISMRSSFEFLKNQKDIAYTSLLLEEDVYKETWDEELDPEYLERFEKEYGIPNLWPYLYVDRILMHGQHVREYPHDMPFLKNSDLKLFLQTLSKRLGKFLDGEKPDAVVFSIVGGIGSLLLYEMAKKRGIKTVIIEVARMDDRITLSESYKEFSSVTEYFNEIRSGKVNPGRDAAVEYLRKFREKPSTYISFESPTARAAHIRFLHPAKLFKSILWHSKTLVKDIRNINEADYTDVFIWWMVWDKIKRKIRALIGYNDLYSPIVEGERFAYFPLHYDPEMATLALAPYYADQISAIKAIAHALPINVSLYVKEHPPMIGYRARKFYKEILKVPNVKLIDPKVSGFSLVKQSELITTLTGTAGWEGILLKKPVIAFGEVFYNKFPLVKHCKGFDELPYLVKEQLYGWKHDEATTVDFVTAMLEKTITSDYVKLWFVENPTPDELKKDESLKKLSGAIATMLGLKLTRPHA